MRVGIVSDIHCNIGGLEMGLAEMGSIDALLCAGDSIFQYKWSNEVVQRLRDLDAHVVLGNHEEIFFSPAMEHAHQRPNVDPELFAWLREQPLDRIVELDGRRALITHSAPWEPRYQYRFPNDPAWSQAATLDVDALVVGHTHFQMARQVGSTLVINPGSAGDPRDTGNAFQLSCAVWDTSTNDVTFYDYKDPTRNFLQHSGQMST